MSLTIKRKKYLLASGCSYTDPNYVTPDKNVPEELRGPWPMWPELMGSKLDLNVLNVGECGNSNTAIYNSIISTINTYEDEIDTIAVLWSGWDRTELFHYWKFQLLHFFSYYSDPALQDLSRDNIFHMDWVYKTGTDQFLNKFKNSEIWNPYLIIRESVNKSLVLMQSLLEICRRRNIKCIFYQGVDPMDYGSFSKFSGTFIEAHHIFSAIKKSSSSKFLEKNKNHVIGWPFLREAAGHHFDSLRYSGLNPFKDSYMHVSEIDKHPNSEAQKIIANIFYDRWKQIYG